MTIAVRVTWVNFLVHGVALTFGEHNLAAYMVHSSLIGRGPLVAWIALEIQVKMGVKSCLPRGDCHWGTSLIFT